MRILEGEGILHGMGIVPSLTENKENPSMTPPILIPRQKILNVIDITHNRQIEISAYVSPEVIGLSKLTFSPFVELMKIEMNPKDPALDLRWHATHLTHLNDEHGRPGWAGSRTTRVHGWEIPKPRRKMRRLKFVFAITF